MGLESGTQISDLNANNPTPQDKRREGDDHLRLIKQVLKTTFPNINGVVNPTLAEINYLQGVTSSIQTQLDAKLESVNIDLTPYAQLALSQQWTRTQYNTVEDAGDQSGTVVLDMRFSPIYKVRAVDDLTVSLANLAEGQDFILKLIQGRSDGGAIITLPNMHWPLKTQPTLVSVQDDYDIVAGKYIDGIMVAGFLGDLG